MRTLLKQYFGFDDFRPMQEKVINHVMAGRDTCVVMPTGSGKSLCYQLPALALDGVTLVISPLIALMKDQVDGLNKRGINAAYINSSVPNARIEELLEESGRGKWKLLYITPERLAMPAFRARLQELPIRLIAVDEAHCISEWGHNFRPEYRQLADARSRFPKVPWIALTATANRQVQADIIRQLKLTDSTLFISSFQRENLTYLVRPKRQWLVTALEALESLETGSAIIYCSSRKETERVADKLKQKKLNALPYHAGLSEHQRRQTQERFIQGRCPIIVATIAFGMGIDKPNVRLVIHADLPRSVEGYYQETGRAGRDGLPSTCLFFYSGGDRWKREYFIQQMEDEQEQARARKQLMYMLQFAETAECRCKFLVEYFGETWEQKTCKNCDVCLAKLPQAAVIAPNKKVVEEYDPHLFEELRALRRRLSESQRVPAFMIFADRSLKDMALHSPQDLPSFREMHGVGPEKERLFGKLFLEAICAYTNKTGRTGALLSRSA